MADFQVHINMMTNQSVERVIDSLQDFGITMVKVNNNNDNGINYSETSIKWTPN